MPDNILILGGNGQVGRALAALLGTRVVTPGRKEIDLLDAGFTKKLDRYMPCGAVINAAAYVQVDQAESEREKAFRVNGEAVGELAAWCKKQGVPLLHYSTDYVFDGLSGRPYSEDDVVDPVNAYGQSKLAGERAIMEQGGQYIILRTSLIFSPYGDNTYTRIMRALHEKPSLGVADNIISCPTYALHLAQVTLAILERARALPEFPSGIYHLCGAAEASRYRFAQAIFALARGRNSGEDSPLICQQIHSIQSSENTTPARRPPDTRLDCAKARAIFGVTLPSWEQALGECYASDRMQNPGLKDHSA